MTNLDTVDRVLRRRFSANALWWRVPVWASMVYASVLTEPTTQRRVTGGALYVVAVLALQAVRHERRAVRRAAVLVTTGCALAACIVLPRGIAEIPVAIAATRAPLAFEAVALWVFVVADTVAFAAVVGYISRSFGGALAGTAIPLLVQRAVEHEELVRERDRAQALLVEVRNARDAETQAAAVQERSRIAREMHDVLAHSLAGLSVQLQGARAVAAKENAGAAVLEPLDRAASLAREGLAEARSAVGALRGPNGRGIDALPALAERHPDPVELRTEGRPGELPPATGHAVYRAVQESLTNAVRYAPGSPVTVTLRWAPGTLTVVVEDAGPAPGRYAVAGQGTGLGLDGMRERVQDVGGRVQAGPCSPRGWRVELEVPAC